MPAPKLFALLMAAYAFSAGVAVAEEPNCEGGSPAQTFEQEKDFAELLAAVQAFNVKGEKEEAAEYKSGALMCQHPSFAEKGRWVETGTHKGDPVKVYAHMVGEQQAGRKTVLYFVGGPGGASHDLQKMASLANRLGYNFLSFDQRGIACSKPDSFATFKDFQFYSSEKTVDDAAAILRSFGISDATVWGSSYGTVPATIFADKYPELTASVLLEGVFSTHGESEIKRTQMQSFFDGLTPLAKQKMMAIPTEKREGVPKQNPVFQFVRESSLVYGAYGFSAIQAHINQLAERNDFAEEVTRLRQDDVKGWDRSPPAKSASTAPNPESYSDWVNRILNQGELGTCAAYPASEYRLINGHVEIVPVAANEAFCSPEASLRLIEKHRLKKTGEGVMGQFKTVQFEQDQEFIFATRGRLISRQNVPIQFEAKNYTLKSPTIYLNGTHDFATPLDLARDHFAKIQNSGVNQQFVEVDRAGHHPTREFYDIGDAHDHACMDSLMGQALAGKITDPRATEECFRDSKVTKLKISQR